MGAHAKQDSVRLTIDIPVEQHTYIKMMAAAEGTSLKQFVIGRLPNPEKTGVKHKNIPKRKFKKLLKKILVEKAPMFKRLADK
jgi:hypothetical protein